MRKERIGRLAARQGGRISSAQLQRLGVGRPTISQWVDQGYLVPVLPKVYAVGGTVTTRAAELWAAVLYAGPGAMLSHATAAHHRGLIIHPPRTIEVSTPRCKVKSLDGRLRVYTERRRGRLIVDGIPVTPIPETLLDLAATSEPQVVRRALSQLAYRRQLDIAAIEAICGHGRLGSRALRAALAIHQPKLAHTNGTLEALFLACCERWGLPLPECNVRVHGVLVDAYWPEHRLVVELDGGGNHSTVGQMRRDRGNDLKLRGHGLSVVRYSDLQLEQQPGGVHRDLLAQMRGAPASEPGQQLLDAVDRDVGALADRQ